MCQLRKDVMMNEEQYNNVMHNIRNTEYVYKYRYIYIYGIPFIYIFIYI